MAISLWLTETLRNEFGAYAGVDEVGLGCWAGPVYACAVVIDNYLWPEIDQLRDSKTIGPGKRTFLSKRIKEECHWSIGTGSVEEIDTYGLRHAHALSIERAVAGLECAVPAVVVDGDAFDLALGEDMPTRFVRHGDDLIPAVAAASIVAKVARDRDMAELSKKFPEYGWDANHAYGTAQHRAALEEYGLTVHHRRSFKPVGRIAHKIGQCCDGTKPACCFMHAPKRVTEQAKKRSGKRG